VLECALSYAPKGIISKCFLRNRWKSITASWNFGGQFYVTIHEYKIPVFAAVFHHINEHISFFFRILPIHVKGWKKRVVKHRPLWDSLLELIGKHQFTVDLEIPKRGGFLWNIKLHAVRLAETVEKK
jgi:hypothetical protein